MLNYRVFYFFNNPFILNQRLCYLSQYYYNFIYKLICWNHILKNTNVYDEDLNPVLEASTNSDLQPLVEYLEIKLSETLTVHPTYKKHCPDHSKYADLIADQIRDMGGNSFSNMFRGWVGPSYYEIVCDVADKVKATYKTGAEISIIEQSILEKILKKALDAMSEDEKNKIIAELKGHEINVGGLTGSSLITLFNAGGFYSYQLAVIIANQMAHIILGHGLSFTANATLTKSLSIIAGPIGWAICGLWTAIDIAGPAYSVTIPSVVHIAMLRMKMNTIQCISCDKPIEKNSTNKLDEACDKTEKEIYDSNDNALSDYIYNIFKRNNDLETYEKMVKILKEIEHEKQKKIELRKQKREKKKIILKQKQSINSLFKDRLQSHVNQVDEVED